MPQDVSPSRILDCPDGFALYLSVNSGQDSSQLRGKGVSGKREPWLSFQAFSLLCSFCGSSFACLNSHLCQLANLLALPSLSKTSFIGQHLACEDALWPKP